MNHSNNIWIITQFSNYITATTGTRCAPTTTATKLQPPATLTTFIVYIQLAHLSVYSVICISL